MHCSWVMLLTLTPAFCYFLQCLQLRFVCWELQHTLLNIQLTPALPVAAAFRLSLPLPTPQGVTGYTHPCVLVFHSRAVLPSARNVHHLPQPSGGEVGQQVWRMAVS